MSSKKSIRRALMIARVGKADGGDVSGVDDVVSAMREGFGDRPIGLSEETKNALGTEGPVGAINSGVVYPLAYAGDAALRGANAGLYGAGRVARRAFEQMEPVLRPHFGESVGSGAQLESDIREMPAAFMGELNVPKSAARTAVDIAKKPAGAAERGMIHLGSEAAPEPTFYSPLERGISEAKQSKMSPQEWKAIASKFPKEEAYWRGLHGFLDKQTGSVTRDQVLAHLKENPVDVQEVWKGGGNDRATELRRIANTRGMTDPERDELIRLEKSGESDNSQVSKYHEHVLPGGENYKEMLLTLPDSSAAHDVKSYLGGQPDLLNEINSADDLNTAQLHNPYLRESIKGLSINDAWKAIQDIKSGKGIPTPYKTNHWSEPNILAHVRMNDRTGPNGEKLLHLEEIQSDWHQQGKEKGYKQAPMKELPEGYTVREVAPLDPYIERKGTDAWAVWGPDGTPVMARDSSLSKTSAVNRTLEALNAERANGIPDAPFKDTKDWTGLALKRVLRHAADNGYDGLTWTTGAQQIDRYDLGKQVSRVTWEPLGNPDSKLQAGNLVAYDHSGRPAITKEGITAHSLPELIGKDAADRLLNKPTAKEGGVHALAGDDLRVGGTGMKEYYDRIVPSVANKLGKEHGAQVGKIAIPSGDKPQNFDTWAWSYQQENGRQNQGHLRAAYDDYVRSLKADNETDVHHLPIKPTMKGRAHKMFQRGGAVNHAPSEAQKDAGNYKKEHVNFQGLDISIENKKGSVRSGKDASGKPWSCKLPADYGYIKGTEGADGDHVDVYLGPDKNSHAVFIVNQHDLKGGFDEHKAFLGYKSETEAMADYCKAFSDGKGIDRLGSLETVSMDAFKKWLKSEKTKKPAHSRNIVEHALKLVSTRQRT